MKQTRNYNVRRDVIAPTTAALNMMQRLNKMSDGDWLLTVVAYNSDEGRAMKAIKTNKIRGKSTDFWSLPLPQETRQYMLKMLMLSDILRNSKHCGVRLPTIDKSHALAHVHPSNPVEMVKVADMAGILISKLKTLNAGMKGSTLGTGGPQYVMVSKKHADQLCESLASGEIVAMQSALVASNTPLNSRTYIVRSDDTLSSIVSRLGVNIRDLQQQDKLHGSKLKPSRSLTIGVGSGAQRLANNSDSITYRMYEDDLLSSIAKRHGVNIKDVMYWNSGTANLQPDDELTSSVKNSNMSDSWQTRQ